MKLICEVAGCGQELTEGTGSHGGPMICPNCRTSSYYWKKQSLSHMRHRRVMLSLFTSRLEYYDPRALQDTDDAQKQVAHTKRQARTAETASRSARH